MTYNLFCITMEQTRDENPTAVHLLQLVSPIEDVQIKAYVRRVAECIETSFGFSRWLMRLLAASKMTMRKRHQWSQSWRSYLCLKVLTWRSTFNKINLSLLKSVTNLTLWLNSNSVISVHRSVHQSRASMSPRWYLGMLPGYVQCKAVATCLAVIRWSSGRDLMIRSWSG